MLAEATVRGTCFTRRGIASTVRRDARASQLRPVWCLVYEVQERRVQKRTCSPRARRAVVSFPIDWPSGK